MTHEENLTVFKGKWIEMLIIKKGDKTSKYAVINSENRNTIGEIKWYGAFRQYAFFPMMNTVYERHCLRDISQFLAKLMLDRKIKEQEQKTQ